MIMESTIFKDLKSTWIKVEPAMVEHVSIEYGSTGPQGGDAGHGGYTLLTVISDSGCYSVETFGTDSGRKGFTLRAKGDWEMEGLEDALIELGLQLALKRQINSKK